MELKKYYCRNCDTHFESQFQYDECPECQSEDVVWEGNYRPYD